MCVWGVGGVGEGRRLWMEADKTRWRIPPVTERNGGGARGSHVHRRRRAAAFLSPT